MGMLVELATYDFESAHRIASLSAWQVDIRLEEWLEVDVLR